MHRPIIGGTCALAAAVIVAVGVIPNKGAGDHSAGGPLKASRFEVAPLRFEPNVGQADARFDFLAIQLDYAAYFSPRGLTLALPDAAGASTFVRLRLLDSDPNAPSVGVEPLRHRSHYFLGDDKSRWRTGVPSYARVRYENVYPGIDLEYYADEEGRLEYDFVVKPGADPSLIRMRCEGCSTAELDGDDALVLRFSEGEIRQPPPAVFQLTGAERSDIPGRFVLRSNRELQFALGEYDLRAELRIDPKIILSTYLGGSGQDFAAAVAYAPDNALWVTGGTTSPNFPGGTGSPPGQRATFVSRLEEVVDEDGRVTRLLTDTILIGGSGDDIPIAMAIDDEGNLCLLGNTSSTDFPVVAASGAEAEYGGGPHDMYAVVMGFDVAPLSPEGVAGKANPVPKFAGTIGGSGDEQATDAQPGDCPDPLSGICYYIVGVTDTVGPFPQGRQVPGGGPGGGRNVLFGGLIQSDGVFAYTGYSFGSTVDESNARVAPLENGAFCLSTQTDSDFSFGLVQGGFPPGPFGPFGLSGSDVFLTCGRWSPGSPDPFVFNIEFLSDTFIAADGNVLNADLNAVDWNGLDSLLLPADFDRSTFDTLPNAVMFSVNTTSTGFPFGPTVLGGHPYLGSNPGGLSSYIGVTTRRLNTVFYGGMHGAEGTDSLRSIVMAGDQAFCFYDSTSDRFLDSVNANSGGRWDIYTRYIPNVFSTALEPAATLLPPEVLVGAANSSIVLPSEIQLQGPPYESAGMFVGGSDQDNTAGRAAIGRGGQFAATAGFSNTRASEERAFPDWSLFGRQSTAQQSTGAFPVTPGAVQPAFGGGTFDAVVIELFQPHLLRRGIVGSADFQPGPVAPGELLSFFSASIGPPGVIGLELGPDGRVRTQLGLTRILFDGEPAAMIFTSRNQAAAIAPFRLENEATTAVQVEFDGVRSNPVRLAVVPAGPGIFSLTQTGVGQGAILNQDFSVNGPANPAAAGSAVQIFLTGAGQTDPPGVDGELAPVAEPLPRLVNSVQVFIGGVEAQVLYAGGAPGLLHGVAQINALIPPGVAADDAAELSVVINGVASQEGITLAVE